MIRLPCFQHLWHDFDDQDAAAIVAALTVTVGELSVEPLDKSIRPELPDYAMPCPREMLLQAWDVEVWYEHTGQALTAAQIVHLNDDGERVSRPWSSRSPQRDGRECGR